MDLLRSGFPSMFKEKLRVIRQLIISERRVCASLALARNVTWAIAPAILCWLQAGF